MKKIVIWNNLITKLSNQLKNRLMSWHQEIMHQELISKTSGLKLFLWIVNLQPMKYQIHLMTESMLCGSFPRAEACYKKRLSMPMSTSNTFQEKVTSMTKGRTFTSLNLVRALSRYLYFLILSKTKCKADPLTNGFNMTCCTQTKCPTFINSLHFNLQWVGPVNQLYTTPS